jgi:hypothetical protein
LLIAKGIACFIVGRYSLVTTENLKLGDVTAYSNNE